MIMGMLDEPFEAGGSPMNATPGVLGNAPFSVLLDVPSADTLVSSFFVMA